MPPGDPTPVIEFRVIDRVEADRRLLCLQAQQEPDLLLADTPGFGALALVTGRQSVAQPPAGSPDQLDITLSQAYFLVEFPVKRFLGGLAEIDPALGELPATVAHATGPEYVAVVTRDDDSDIGPESLRVDYFADSFHGAYDPRFHYPAVYGITPMDRPEPPACP